MSPRTGDLFEFGSFVLDPAKQQLFRDGEAVSLTPKTFDLLRVLVENHDRTLTKEELIKAVWPDSFVDQSNLTQQIAMIRRALGDTAGDPRFVTTVPARGYRFTAEVIHRPYGASAPALTPVAIEPPPVVMSSGTRRWLWIAVALLLAGLFGYLAVAAIRNRQTSTANHLQSLAVLPFQNLRNDGENDFLGFSLADAVITKLGPIGSLAVRPSSAIEKYRGKSIDLRAAAADLHVDALLTGNFVRDGDDLRITVQLTNVKTEGILWRRSLDIKYSKLLTVHDVVAREIVNGLRLSLSPSETARLEPEAPIDPAAYEYFLRGVDLYSRNEFPTAIQMLRKSAELAPNYALTWAHLGRALTASASFELGGRKQYDEAQQAYDRALSIDPAEIETRVFMANLLTDTGRVEEAVPLLRDALKANANHAEVHWELGYAYRFGGMLNESVAECERARALDPVVKLYSSTLNGYLYLGQYDRFLRSLPPDNGSPFILFYRGFGEYHRGEREQAAQHFDAAFQSRPSLLQARLGRALTEGIRENTGAGLEMLREMEQQITMRGVGDPEATYKLAQAFAALGDTASSLRCLSASVEGGFFSYPYFMADPLMAPLRANADFVRLMQTARGRHETFRRKFF